ncbi:hypothetical protein Baya_8559 [Bagarius yarrelli]|uniref:Uncharacterized protein n=1 Tax=Bagarius yarrelli TaxID=175774 RepID=A0A556U614_BAGYA|nr:hypothetical protein Baya_8559 [Bagarius yarrelli]
MSRGFLSKLSKPLRATEEGLHGGWPGYGLSAVLTSSGAPALPHAASPQRQKIAFQAWLSRPDTGTPAGESVHEDLLEEKRKPLQRPFSMRPPQPSTPDPLSELGPILPYAVRCCPAWCPQLPALLVGRGGSDQYCNRGSRLRACWWFWRDGAPTPTNPPQFEPIEGLSIKHLTLNTVRSENTPEGIRLHLRCVTINQTGDQEFVKPKLLLKTTWKRERAGEQLLLLPDIQGECCSWIEAGRNLELEEQILEIRKKSQDHSSKFIVLEFIQSGLQYGDMERNGYSEHLTWETVSSCFCSSERWMLVPSPFSSSPVAPVPSLWHYGSTAAWTCRLHMPVAAGCTTASARSINHLATVHFSMATTSAQ